MIRMVYRVWTINVLITCARCGIPGGRWSLVQVKWEIEHIRKILASFLSYRVETKTKAAVIRVVVQGRPMTRKLDCPR